jgi:S-adenosylmethionine hydrolase
MIEIDQFDNRSISTLAQGIAIHALVRAIKWINPQFDIELRRNGEKGLRTPKFPYVLITDFGYAKPDSAAVNQCFLAYRDVCLANNVLYEPPLIEDRTVYSLNITSGSHLVSLYSEALNNTQAIFVVVVDPGVGGKREGIVVETNKGHVFVGPNNGVAWEMIEREGLKRVYKIKDDVFNNARSATFHGRDVFIPIAASITSGNDMSELTSQLEVFDPNRLVKYIIPENVVKNLDGFNLIKVKTKIPDDGPRWVNVTVTHRVTGEAKTLRIPLAEKFVDLPIGSIMAYPGSESDRGMEIAVSGKVHNFENSAVNLLTIDPKNPIAPGDILGIEWIY